MNNSTVSKKVLHAIHERGIEPTARWKFIVKNIALWGIACISFAAGVLSVSALIHVTKSADWDIYAYFGRSLAEHTAIVFPYFWFAIIALFAVLAYTVTRITKQGYRYARPAIIITAALTLAVAGSAFYALGIGEQIDEMLSSYSTLYTRLPNHKMQIWNRPEVGLLAGTITRIISNNEFELRDFSARIWTIEEGDVRLRRGSSRKVGAQVKLIGLQLDENVFVVNEMRPWITPPKPPVK